jgi:hypothetical protein
MPEGFHGVCSGCWSPCVVRRTALAQNLAPIAAFAAITDAHARCSWKNPLLSAALAAVQCNRQGRMRNAVMIDPHDLAPPDYCDPVIEAYKKDVDRTLLRENLKLTVEERFHKFKQFMKYVEGLREAGRKARETRSP